MIGVDQEKEGYHPESTIITITDKTQILDYGLNLEDQGPGVDLIQGYEQIETELDVVDAESMTIM